MLTLLLVGLAGFLAQLVSGTLGMGYGMTATTALVVFGTAPAIASASAHFAQVGTSLASGVSHWRFRNVDWRAVGILAGPGSVGAVIGAVLLVSFSADFATGWMSVILFALGVYVLVRFAFLRVGKLITEKRPGVRFLAPLGLVAGFVDATGGGGWGPVATTTLLSSGRLEPRKVVGSVQMAEFAVTVSASLAFLAALSLHGMDFAVVAALLIGGVLAAPIGAVLTRRMPPRLLGTAAGGLIVLTNGWQLLGALGAAPVVIALVYVALTAFLVTALLAALRSMSEERRINALVGEDGVNAAAERARR
ncbi:sulfite exporter TauE/SafE family protein [Saccharomonospora azurea]|uniref:Probable membrane transporter protein n=1 Tax=Saccharomonospora azurea NA-128 TaxID=882081 RepID=H8G8X8_9PSEU|nr:sulfite exporter TauE/SafE family protein [Saccharomonospora azurea]EHY89494.1 putative permease [Saccharomonospora azurea NA-128]